MKKILIYIFVISTIAMISGCSLPDGAKVGYNKIPGKYIGKGYVKALGSKYYLPAEKGGKRYYKERYNIKRGRWIVKCPFYKGQNVWLYVDIKSDYSFKIIKIKPRFSKKK